MAPESNSPHSPPVNTYARLLNAARVAQNMSYEDVDRRGGMPKSTAHRAMQDVRMKGIPTSDTIAGLSRALGITERRIRVTVAESLGLVDGEPIDGLDVDGLDPEMVSALQQVVNQSRRQFNERAVGGRVIAHADPVDERQRRKIAKALTDELDNKK